MNYRRLEQGNVYLLFFFCLISRRLRLTFSSQSAENNLLNIETAVLKTSL